MKKATIIGRGTAGTLAYLKMLELRAATEACNGPMEIEWCYDPSVKAMSVGEGTTPTFPKTLFSTAERIGVDFDLHEYSDMTQLDARPKMGIEYENWGSSDFVHPFGMGSYGIHFNAAKFQDYVFDRYSNLPNVSVIDKKVSHDDIDSDLIIDCSGTPKSFEDYDIPKYIPVNAVHITQCDWVNGPQGFYTKTIARPWGWVFVIPLITRCAVGYLYNHEISSLDQVKADVENVFDELGVLPRATTNSFHFNNYVRKNLIEGRVAYAGNSGFFLEPMEATTLDCVARILKSITRGPLQAGYNPYLKAFFQEIEYFIMMHYAAGSKWKNEFWDFATERGKAAMAEAKRIPFFNAVYAGRVPPPAAYELYFGPISYKINQDGLGLSPTAELMAAE